MRGQLATSYTTLFLQSRLPMTAIQADDHTYVCLAHSELRTRKCVACPSISWFGHGGAWYTLTFVVGCRRIKLAGDIAGIVPSGELEGIL